ncbi:proline-rich protein 3-like [Diospyros lotus]|uniref:proline-rich protein 3-like n=1 Tax=Diospyros lotus TaxID=55363 RepID=UPI00224EE3F4|nr:proline-rich protein 3-like [Diospyros lotus]
MAFTHLFILSFLLLPLATRSFATDCNYASKPELEKPNYSSYVPKKDYASKSEIEKTNNTNGYGYGYSPKPDSEKQNVPKAEIQKPKSNGYEYANAPKPEEKEKPNNTNGYGYGYSPKPDSEKQNVSKAETQKPKSNGYEYAYAPKPEEKEKPKLQDTLLSYHATGIQGLIYCKSGGKLIPLQGALARITCLAVNMNGYESASFSVLSQPTDAKGYFLTTVSAQQLKAAGGVTITECKAFLEKSPLESCKVATDVNKGISGAPLPSKYRLLSHNIKLFSVGPFFYTPQSKSSVSGGY